MSLLVGLTMMLEFCQVDAKAQFGIGNVQNCQFSSCTQNNFGRKRRQILEEILAEVEAEEDSNVVKRQAQEQNCQGSECNQNNLGGAGPIAPEPVPAPPPAPVPVPVPVPAPSPVEVPVPVPSPVEVPVPVPSPVQVPIQVPVPVPSPVEIPFPVISQVPVQVPVPVLAPSPVEIPVPVLPQVPVPAPVPGPFPFPAGFPFTGLGAVAGGAQVQNCQGSTCSQNNLGRKKRQIAEAIHALAVDVLEAEDEAVTDDVVEPISKRQVQTCVGSSCNQNNFGRKKRQIAEAIDALTTDVLEDENEAVAKAKRDAEAQSQNCFGGSGCNQNNFGRRKREVIAALLQELQ